jgi:hypothetical protein
VLSALEDAGDEDDRELGELLPELIRQVVAQQVRQEHVQHRQRRRVAPGNVERLLCLGGGHDVVARVLEEVRQE